MFDKLKAMGAVANLMKNQEGLKVAAARVRGARSARRTARSVGFRRDALEARAALHHGPSKGSISTCLTFAGLASSKRLFVRLELVG